MATRQKTSSKPSKRGSPKPSKRGGAGGRGGSKQPPRGGKGGGGAGDGRELDLPLHEIAQSRYLNYALSVITSRALPDVRDGLKPVQRRKGCSPV